MHRYLNKLLSVSYRFLPAPRAVTVTLRGGYKMSLRPNADQLERQLYFHKTYEAATLALFDAVLRPGDVMVDIGANLGLMTLHAARIVGPTGRVIALEPHPSYFPRLAAHVEMNALGNVTLLQLAAGEKREARTIFDVPSINIGRSSLIRPSATSTSGGEVAVEPLDEILARLHIDAVRLIKIDVEGFEPNVLRGAVATIRKQPIICMEVSADVDREETNPLAAHDIIMQTGLFSAYRCSRGKGHPSGLVPAVERSTLAVQRHDNVIYVPHSVRSALSESLFD